MGERNPEANQLEIMLADYQRLKEENTALRRLLIENGITFPAQPKSDPPAPATQQAQPAGVNEHSGKDAKIALFRSLFRGREDVYAVRMRFKSGEWGYVPASIRDWKAVLSADAAVRKKVDQRTRKLLPLTDLCKAIARKEVENRQRRRAQLRAGLISAISEEPPPAVATAAKRLGCSNTYLTRYFPDLCRQLAETRKSWRLKEREAVQRRIEKAVGEMPGASVPEVCRATGVRQMFLYRHFPALYKRIASDFIARRDALRRQKRAALRRDVSQAVTELITSGARPHVNNVAPFLSAEAGRDWRRIQQEIDRAMRTRGANVEA